MLAGAAQTVAGSAKTRNVVAVQQFLDDFPKVTVITNLKLLAMQVLVFLLVAVFLHFLMVIFVVANLEVGATVNLGNAVLDGLGAEFSRFTGGENHASVWYCQTEDGDDFLKGVIIHKILSINI